MRNAFIEALCREAQADGNVWLLNADLGYSVLEPFSSAFPDRYLNVGIAEQNMVGIAAGLALSGKTVFCYSIVNFATLRCLEQIRNDVCYHNAPVIVVSVGAGFVYGTQGYTHHGLEDMAVMRTLPNIAVYAPADPVESRLAVSRLVQRAAPGYLRLSKAGDQILHPDEQAVDVSTLIRLRSGEDVALICAGNIVGDALEAAELLAASGVSVSVFTCPLVKPLPEEEILDTIESHSLTLTLEEGIIYGGFGSSVAELAVRRGINPLNLDLCGVEHPLQERAYTQKKMKEIYRLNARGLEQRVKKRL